MKKVVQNFKELMLTVYGVEPSKQEVEHQVMSNNIFKSIAVLKQLKKEDEELIQKGIHCHLY